MATFVLLVRWYPTFGEDLEKCREVFLAWGFSVCDSAVGRWLPYAG